ncbi:MAG: aldehyde dehydrogenase family protein, partial [Deltaproteobacteria bacterium]|nr:aldehyde dehydrogenase family protein [Deltaproteobacteria bacterium]
MPSAEIVEIFEAMGLTPPADVDGGLAVEDPSTGQTVATVAQDDREAAMAKLARAHAAFASFREVPGPVRGELVRQIGVRLREHKDSLARLVCVEMGKGIEEARGEVQEMIDICDFATGLSRSLGGRTMMSERAGHRMFEQWQPLGTVLCITAFNFPVAVWAWNAALALVCGDPVVWKPSLKTPLTAMATHALVRPVMEQAGHPDVLQLTFGPDAEVGQALVDDPRVPLVSATGSCAMGRKVAPRVAARLGRTLLELGGNNAVIVDHTADLDLAARAIAFGAAGTAGQRCTSTRRLLVAGSIAEALTRKVVAAYHQLIERIGDPRDAHNLVGPLIDAGARDQFIAAIERIRADGGEIVVGGRVVEHAGYFVEPTVVKVPTDRPFPLMDEETFAPILYVRSYDDDDLDGAIAVQNQVEQGLSSAIFTDSLRSAE